MKSQKLWVPPSSWRSPSVGANKDKWCDNHEAPGHETNECVSLKYSINNAVQKGELKQFVDHGGNSAPQRGNQRDKGKEKMNYPPPPPNPNKRGMINMIHGGVASGGPSANAREVYAARIDSAVRWRKRPREKEDLIIEFSEKDKSHIVFPHDDALVITLDIDNFDVKRILVDGGSSADVISLRVLESIGKTKSDLKPVSFPLVGFTGAASYPLGMITLPVTMGQGWTQLKVDVNFLVVEHLGAYNGILGRTTINPYEIVPSTVHQKLKYITENGIGEVLGDQRTARQCYVNSLRHRQHYPETVAMVMVGGRKAKYGKKRKTTHTNLGLGVTLRLSRRVFTSLAQGPARKKKTEEATFPWQPDTEMGRRTMQNMKEGFKHIDDVVQIPGESIESYFLRFVRYGASLNATKGEALRAFLRNMHNSSLRGYGGLYEVVTTTTMRELKDKLDRAFELERSQGIHSEVVEGEEQDTGGVSFDFTPLKVQVEELFNKYLKQELPEVNEEGKAFLGKDAKGWCEYHETWGHKTNDCLVLKIEIEEKLYRGELQEYVAPRALPMA